MQTLKTITLTAVFLLSLFIAGTAHADLTNGLLAFWPLNGDAQDATGNNHNGTVFGATPTTDRFGNAGQAMFFNGTSDHIIVPASHILSSPTFSISVWIMTTGPINGRGFIITSDPNNAIGHCSHGFMVLVHPDLRAYARADAAACGSCCGVVTGSPLDPTWHHIGFTHDGIVSKLYIDGALQATTQNVAYSPTSAPVRIGSDLEGATYTEFFLGTMDDIRLYNRALSPAEILLLFSSPPDLNSDGFVDAADLATLLTQWGTAGNADFNGDGVVDAADLATLLTNWGSV